MHTAKIAIFKNHPRDILHDKKPSLWNTTNPFYMKYRIKTWKYFQAAGYRILLAKFWNYVCLTDHSYKARDQTKQHTSIILWKKNTLTGAFLGFW